MMEGFEYFFPMEVIVMILSRLPTKSLLKFKAVCKSWNALIASTSFIHTHLLHSNTRTRLVGRTTDQNLSLFRFQDDQFLKDGLPESPSPDPEAIILCSCNGVLLLQDKSLQSLFLWNPSMRKIEQLHFQIPFKFYNRKSIKYGLCYDPVAADLKIVLISWNEYVVYSCKNKSLSEPRKNLACEDGNEGRLYLTVVSVGGASYWISCPFYQDSMRKTACYVGDLVCYDSERDELKTLKKPKDLTPTDIPCLICFRDRLCVWFNDDREAVARIWMKEKETSCDVWMEFMKIENFPRLVKWERPFYMDENQIVVDLWNGRVSRYSFGDKTYKKFEYSWEFKQTYEIKEHAPMFRQRIFNCVDSLIFFSDEKSTSNRKRKLLG